MSSLLNVSNGSNKPDEFSLKDKIGLKGLMWENF